MRKFLMSGLLALAVSVAGLTPRVAAQAKAPQPKSKGELEALQALFNAQDPDARIKAADGLVSNYADTDFKDTALFMAAFSYQQKNDPENAVIYAERVLEANPKHYQSMLMLAELTAQRTREHDLDKEEKLSKAEKYAKGAQDLIKTAEKPNPSITDEQWEAGRKDMSAQALQALGLVAMVRKKYDDAATQFKAALDSSSQPDPATMVRLGAAYNQAGKPDEAIPILEKVMAMTDVHPSIKQFAQAEKARAAQIKGGAKPAGGAPAPPQVEIKKP
jgi:tetratricopeptide (TPR) repeat protein